MFKMQFETDNAAFGDSDFEKRIQTARLLREAADELHGGARSEGVLRDENGNTIGRWKLA